MRRPTLLTVVTTLLLALPPGAFAAESAATDVSALIEQLDDSEFARREAAVNALQQRGADVIPPLVKAAQAGSPEVSSRAVQLLEHFMESDQAATIDAADAALDSLLDSSAPQAAALAGAALERNAPIREQRAIAKITELGGQIQMGPQLELVNQPQGLLIEPNAMVLRPRTILLGRDWKGGVEGLKYLRRLTHIYKLQLYIEQGSNVPLTEAQALAGVLPGLDVHHRGPYLGIGSMSNGVTDCIISEVKPDSPAAKAGLQPRDTIVALNDQPIQQFHALVDELKSHAIGDTVTITVQRYDTITRQERLMDIDVELEGWKLAPVDDNLSRP